MSSDDKPQTEKPRTPKRFAILGAGRLGGGIAQIIAAAGQEVVVWARREMQRRQVEERCKGAQQVSTVETVAEAAEGADVVFFAVPAAQIFEVACAFGKVATGNQIALHGSRGVASACELPHQSIRRATCIKKVGALGGPLYLDDLEMGQPLFAVVGSRYSEVVEAVRALAAGTQVKVHGCMDPIGVEVAGAISNVAMIAAGMAETLGLGETARGVLLTHGLSDSQRFGVAIGAELSTFTGLAGVGDLIPRSVSSTKRNTRLGELVADGMATDAAVEEVHGSVEGVRTASEIMTRAEHLGLDLPLVQAVNDVLTGRRDPREALDEVLHMDLYLGREAVAQVRA